MPSQELMNLLTSRWPVGPIASSTQLKVAGVDHRALTAAVRDGVLIRVRRGVYVRRDVWKALPSWDRDRLRIEAHWLATRGRCIYSHVSAARLLRCATWVNDDRVHLTVPYSVSRASHARDVMPHSFPLTDQDMTEVRLESGALARTTTLERTVADCARTLETERAAIIGDHALRLGATLHGIRDAAERTGAARGSRRLDDLLGLLDPRSESPGETRTRLALLAAGLPAPQLQFDIPTAEGLFRADFAWPELMVILEFDGESKYFDYRPPPAVLLAERRRENALVVEGWTLVRVRWSDFSSPGSIPARVLAAFERARRLAG